MDQQPKTRQETKKNQGKKGRPEKLGTSKGVRAKEANQLKNTAQKDSSKK
jgi:hypothetical protein